MMFEDKLSIPCIYGGSHDVHLKHALGTVPKGDSVPLAEMIAGATSRIGLVVTMSTLGYPPFLLARLTSTIDSLSEGRFGWNIVTSAEDSAAQNFGLDVLPPRDERYARADEYLDLVKQLWRSWDPDAIVCGRERAVYADGRKVRTIDFEGRWYKCRGPLNTAPSPQVVPTLVQARGSSTGRDFTARHSYAIVAPAGSVEDMKAFRDEIGARARAHRRNPDETKLLYLVTPTLGETEDDARRRFDALVEGDQFVERKLAAVSAITGIDLSVYDWDAPLPGRLICNGE